MRWEQCDICKEDIIVFDLKPYGTKWRCDDEQRCAEVAAALPTPGAGYVGTAEQFDSWLRSKTEPLLQEDFGFTKPEDGSERRFVANETKQTIPWVEFRFWWWVHNAIAHPLIAIAPRRVFFRLHDYTSRRMHGVK